LPSAPTVDPSYVTEYCLNDPSGASALTATIASGHTYTWYDNSSPNPQVLAVSPNTYTPSLTSVGTQVYRVTQTNTNGCESSALLVTVTVHDLPSVSAGSDVTVCDGSSVTLTGTGASTYSWLGSDGNTISNGVSFVPPGQQTTLYTVTGTDGNGCVATDVVEVTSNAAAVISLSASPLTICAGEEVVLTASGGVSYSWGPGVTVNTATPNQQTVTPTTTTTYTVTGTDANGCTGTDHVTVTVNALPSATDGRSFECYGVLFE